MTLHAQQLWYDLGGLNTLLFQALYGAGVEGAKPLLPFLEWVGAYEHFAYVFGFACMLAVVQYFYRKFSGFSREGYFIRSQICWLASIVLGYVLTALAVGLLKEWVSFPRPFVEMEQVKLLFGQVEAAKIHQSFPSGHAAMAGFLVVAFWSRVLNGIKPFLILLLATMCWSRVAIGLHFPADVLYGAAIGLFLTGLARSICCKIFGVWK